jgi:hypothetical protein
MVGDEDHLALLDRRVDLRRDRLHHLPPEPGRLRRDPNQRSNFAGLAYLDPDIEWLGPPEWLEDRLYLGHDGVRRLASFWTQSFDGFRLDLEQVIDLESNEVVVLINQRGRMKGSENWIEQPVGWHLQLRDGRVVRAYIYFTWADALKAVGLT